MTSAPRPPWRAPTDEEWQLLDRYVAGACGLDEQRAIQGLLERDPGLAAFASAMRGDGTPAELWDASRAWRGMQIRMAGNGQANPPAMLRLVDPDGSASWSRPARRPNLPRHRAMSRVRARIAAVAGAILVASVAALVLWRPAAPANPEASIAMREVTTRSGQVATVQLNDGTIVTIGPQTRLRIPPTFGEQDRTVTLDGEAFFDVAARSRAPFVVQTARAVTRVLGTRFNVRAYGVRATTVAVVSGKVSLAADQAVAPGVTITAGYVGTVTPDGEAGVRQATLDQYIGWTRGRFVFDSTRVSDVFDRLGRWYGVQLVAGDSTIARQRLTAEWQDRTLESVLRSLSIALKANVARRGDEVTVSSRDRRAAVQD